MFYHGFSYFLLNIISGLSLYKEDLQHKYRVSSIERNNSGIVSYQINYGIDATLLRG